jgi:hypothetical protein
MKNFILFISLFVVIQLLILPDKIMFILTNNTLSFLLIYYRAVRTNKNGFTIWQDCKLHWPALLMSLTLVSVLLFTIKTDFDVAHIWGYLCTFTLSFYAYFTFIMWILEKMRKRIWQWLFSK